MDSTGCGTNEECKTEPIVFVEVFVDHDNYQNEVDIDNLPKEDPPLRKERKRRKIKQEAGTTIVDSSIEEEYFSRYKNKIDKCGTEAGTSFLSLGNVQVKNEPADYEEEEENEEAVESEIPGVSIKMEDFEAFESSSCPVKVENVHEDDIEFEESDIKPKTDYIDFAMACKLDENSSDNCPFNECLKCSKYESDLASLLKHDCIKRNNSGECVICESISKQVSDMKFHLNMSHDNIVRPVTEPHFPYPFPCKWCGKTFATEYRLEVHKFIHKLVKTYKCRECEKKFVKFETVVKHELLHPELLNFPRNAEYMGQLFSCSTCELKFDSPQLLADHRKIHATFFCHQCHMTFGKKHTLTEHVKKKHLVKSERNFECPECKRQCQNAVTLKRHIRVIHKELADALS